MQTAVQVELTCGAKFSVEGEVKTLADFRRLLARANDKLRKVSAVWSEAADEKVAKVRIGPVREAAAAAGS